MTSSQSPVIIRQSPVQRWTTKPGLHAYNTRRRFNALRERISNLSILQLCLVALGLAGIGYYAYTLADEYVYQSFQNWAFDQGIAGRANVTFTDYLSERTLLGFLVRGNRSNAIPAIATKAEAPDSEPQKTIAALAHGAVLGRLEIPSLHLSAMVREGVDDKVLRVAVGHVPATALAGQRGNFAIAAHRDTLFRALKNIGSGDLVTFQASDGNAYQYRVAATQIVRPSDVSVLRADGGGLITGGGSIQGMPKLLTMITCYPFSYIGSAPKRFIVEAKLIENEEASKEAAPTVAPEQMIAALPSEEKAGKVTHKTHVHAAMRHRRAPRSKHISSRGAVSTVVVSTAPAKPFKKKSFWHKLFSGE
jgi:sortase A